MPQLKAVNDQMIIIETMVLVMELLKLIVGQMDVPPTGPLVTGEASRSALSMHYVPEINCKHTITYTKEDDPTSASVNNYCEWF